MSLVTFKGKIEKDDFGISVSFNMGIAQVELLCEGIDIILIDERDGNFPEKSASSPVRNTSLFLS